MTARLDDGAFDGVGVLRAREREILDLFSKGLQNRVVATERSIAEETVRSHARVVGGDDSRAGPWALSRTRRIGSGFGYSTELPAPQLCTIPDGANPGEPGMDAVLISRCQAGDANAFGPLFEQYKNLVYKTAYLMTEPAAEDILQEVFLQVHGSLGAYNPSRGSLSTWLQRITVNRCLNWRRGQRFLWILESAPRRSGEGVDSRRTPRRKARGER